MQGVFGCGWVLCVVLSAVQARLSTEQARLLVSALQQNLAELPHLMDLYTADLMYKLAPNTLDTEHLQAMESSVFSTQLTGLPLNRGLLEDIRLALDTWRSDVLDLDKHEAMRDKINAVLEDIADDLEVPMLQQMYMLMEWFVDAWQRRMKEEDRRRTPDDVVRLVWSEEHGLAAQLTQSLSLDSAVTYIVRKAYASSKANFLTVMAYAASIKNVVRAFTAYQAIYYVLVFNNHDSNVADFLSIYENIHNNVENLPGFKETEPDFKRQVMNLKERVKYMILLQAIKSLKRSFLKNRAQSSGNTNMCKRIYVISKTLYKDIGIKVVKELFYKISTVKLLEFVGKQTYITQIVEGLEIVFQHMKTEGNWRGLLKAGQIIKTTMKLQSYIKLSDDYKDNMRSMKAQLGESIHNVVFADDVCLKNVDRGGYLTGGHLLGNKTEFKVLWKDNALRLQRVGAQSALCATRKMGLVYERTRPVLEGYRRCEKEWWVEPRPDGACRIRSIKLNEYLLARDSGEVGTRLGGRKPRGSTWRIELCQESNSRAELKRDKAKYEEIMKRTRDVNQVNQLIQLGLEVQKLYNYNFHNSELEFQSDLEGLNKEVWAAVVTQSTELLKHSLVMDAHPPSQNKLLCKRLHEVSPDLYRLTVDQVVQAMFSKVSTLKFLDFVSEAYDIDLQVDGLEVILQQMRNVNNMTALLKLGYLIKRVLEEAGYTSIQEHYSHTLMDMKAGLGQSIRNAVFAESVCISNVDRARFLNGSTLGNKTEWNVVWHDRTVRIQRRGSERTLCVAKDSQLLQNKTRPVLEGGRDCGKEWWVEPLPDGACLIKNVQYNEYLLAGETGEVGTRPAGSKPTPGTTWRLELCEEHEGQLMEYLWNYTAIYQNIVGVAGEKDVLALIDTLQHIKTLYIYNVPNSDSLFESGVRSLMNQVQEVVIEESTTFIKHSLDSMTREDSITFKHSLDRTTSEDSKELCRRIFQYSPAVHHEVLSKVTADMFHKLPTSTLLDFVSQLSGLPQVIVGLDIVLDKMKAEHNSTHILTIAEHIKHLVHRPGYLTLEPKYKNLVRAMSPVLGQSIKNAVFEGRVCILNVRQGGYLHGVMLGGKAAWDVIWLDNTVTLQRVGAEGALCAKRQSGLLGNTTRPVLEGGRGCEEQWWVEPLPDGACIIRNVKFSEYLFADETWQVGTRPDTEGTPGSTWTLELCDEINPLSRERKMVSNMTAMYHAMPRHDKDVSELLRMLGRTRHIVEYLHVNDLEETESELKSRVDALLMELAASVREEGLVQLKRALKDDDHDQAMTNKLTATMFLYAAPLYRVILEELTRDVFDVVSTNKLLDFVCHQLYIQQDIVGLSVVLRHMQQVDDTTAMLKVGHLLATVVPALQNATDIEEDDRRLVESMKNALGRSIHNAVFGGRVCIHNVEHDKYLSGSVLGKKAPWDVLWLQDSVTLQRVATDTALCVGSDRTRPVLEGGRSCGWWVEPLPDGACLIRSIESNEYLFAEVTGEVVTMRDHTQATQAAGSLWQLELCTDEHS